MVANNRKKNDKRYRLENYCLQLDDQFEIYIFMLMQTESQILQQSEFVKKNTIRTPPTSESLLLGTSPKSISQAYKKLGFPDDTPLFNVVQEEFQHKFLSPEDSEAQEEILGDSLEEQASDCSLKVGIRVISENQKLQKYFQKQVKKLSQGDGNAVLVFEEQHQRVQLQASSRNSLMISLIANDSFEKLIWTVELLNSEEKKKSAVISLKDKEKGFILNIESQTQQKTLIKPLGFSLPTSSIEDFYDYRLRLLNKSEELNQITSITELRGILYPLTKQNMGSRIIQKLLNRACPEDVEKVLIQLRPYFVEMVTDKYGNYVVQKIFKMATGPQRRKCLETLCPNICQLAKNKAGTHSLQSIVDFLNQQQIKDISKLVKENINELCIDQFGHHLVIKLLAVMNGQQLIEEILSNLATLSSDRFGVVVVKKTLKKCSSKQQLRIKFIGACCQNFNLLAQREYGHYIIQELFLYYNIYQLEHVLAYLTTYISYLAQNQFSSSIIRKSIETYGDYLCVPYIQMLLQGGVGELMETCSGNFVLHRLMENTQNQHIKNSLINEMMLIAPDVRCYEKRQKWLKFFNIQ